MVNDTAKITHALDDDGVAGHQQLHVIARAWWWWHRGTYKLEVNRLQMVGG
jgi:hypothetical protein